MGTDEKPAKRVVYLETVIGDGVMLGPLAVAELATFLRLETDEDKQRRERETH